MQEYVPEPKPRFDENQVRTTIEELIDICRDGEQGYAAACDHVKEPESTAGPAGSLAQWKDRRHTHFKTRQETSPSQTGRASLLHLNPKPRCRENCSAQNCCLPRTTRATASMPIACADGSSRRWARA